MIGSTISHYRIETEVGRGGMGIVYKAHDTRLDRAVALKFLPPDKIQDEKHRSRIVSEARAASALNHPNILTIYDIDSDEDRIYIVMEFLEGQTLQQRLIEGPISIESAIEIAYQLVGALRVAHDHAIIHRDIKPGNVMLAPDGRVKIMDFGLAKRTGQTTITEEGHTIGTAAYMSPEQTRGEKVDLRTDIWSLGVVLFEMLTHERPFKGDYVPAVVYSVLNEEPPDARTINPLVPEALVTILGRCLKKDKENRYSGLDQLLADLNRFVSDAGITLSSAARVRYQPARRISRPIVAGLFTLVVVLFVFALPILRAALFPAPDFPITRIAVLPITPVGDNEMSPTVCHGLLQNLTGEIASLRPTTGSFSVVPSNEIIAYDIESVTQAANMFGIDFAISSVVSWTGEQVRLTMTLIDAALMQIMDEVNIDASIDDLLAFQDQFGREVAELFDINFEEVETPGSQIRGTQVPLAYQLYLDGLGHLSPQAIESEVDSAITYFERAIQEDPRYANAFAGLGEAYARKFELTSDPEWFQKATESAYRALSIDSAFIEVHETIGFVNNLSGNHEEAESAYRRALAIDPARTSSKIGLAEALSGQGISDSAEETFFDAIRAWPEYYYSQNKLGIFYFHQARFEEAAERFETAIELNPKFGLGYNNLSQAYDRIGRSDEVLELLEKAISMAPEEPMAYRNLASRYYIEHANYPRAVELLERARSIRELDYINWSVLANSYYWAPGEREKADDAWIRTVELALAALSVNSSNKTAVAILAESYAHLGRDDEALETVRVLQELGSLSPRNLLSIGYVHETIGERGSALVYVRHAIEEDVDTKYVLNTPWLEDLRSDPRFLEIRAQFGL